MKTNQFRAMMLVLLMAVVSLGVVNAQTLTVTGTVTDVADGTNSGWVRFGLRAFQLCRAVV